MKIQARWLLILSLVVCTLAWGGLAAPAVADTSATATLPRVTLAVDETSVVSLSMDTAGSPVVAIDLIIAWDPAVMRIDSVALGDLTQGWLMAENLTADGEMRVAMSAIEPANGSGTLLEMTLAAMGGDGDSTPFTITKCVLNDGAIPCTLHNGQVVLADALQPYQISLPLVVGWNLVSLPMQPDQASVQDIIRPVEDRVEMVLAYDPEDVVNPWQNYSPGVPEYANDLYELHAGQGFWIKASQEATLVVDGTIWEGDLSLTTGWNLVGYVGESSADVAQALGSLSGQYEVVYGFSAENALSPWTSYCPQADPQDNTLNELVPGMGYWILMTEPGVWETSS